MQQINEEIIPRERDYVWVRESIRSIREIMMIENNNYLVQLTRCRNVKIVN